MNDPVLEALNPAQLEAVTHGKGPLLILAGAGSGKTRSLTYRIAYLIRENLCPPNQILAVTFTNKAAEEMKSRVHSLLGDQKTSPLVCTFHSLGVRILRRFAERIGYRTDFTICDSDDQKRLVRRIYKDLGLSDKEVPMRLTLSIISRAKNQGWGPADYESKAFDRDGKDIARVFKRYQIDLENSNAVDFDDLILLTVKLLRDSEETLRYYSDWYRHLLIDEYQDTNAPQYDLITCLASTHRNVCAVGDEDQSIYRFRGADINNILRFEADFPGSRLIKLEQNYRSTQTILDAAGAVVANNSERKGKVLWTKRQGGDPVEVYPAPDAKGEAEWVAEKIRGYLESGRSRIGVLYRTNFQSRAFEEALNNRRIRYKLVGGVSFYSRKEVKDALAYLRLALNPLDNVSLLRIINQPARGIGRTTLDRLQTMAAETVQSLWPTLERGLNEHLFPARTHAALQRFYDAMTSCRERLKRPLHLVLNDILRISGYVDALETEGSEESQERILNLKELVNVAREGVQSGISIQDFLDHAALRADSDDYDAAAPVTLMTLHNAKGLEFSLVFLAGCEEGLFPHQRAIDENDIEEERRLCYVGMTRAQDKLHLSFSKTRRFFGRELGHGFTRPSRFLEEIPPQLVRSLPPPGGVTSPLSSGYRRMVYQHPKRDPRQQSPYAGKTYNDKDTVKGYLDQLSRQKAGRGERIVKGSIVVHQRYGEGRVLHVEKRGDDLKATVQFPGFGIKKLVQKYAKLRLA